MAKVKGPLMSVSASGSIANTLTMLRASALNIAKKKSKPGGSPSAAQLARRAFYRQAANDWSALDANAKAAWKPAADARQVTPFNAYMSAQLATFTGGATTVWDGGTTTWDNGTTVWN